ncbi:MAG TPA: TIGR03790 family protein [Verrucomicrobiae bacterium]|nr:TIGR03790 family protein [Verrucomicrobiae bacterium]
MTATHFLRCWTGLVLLWLTPVLARAGGDEVVVVYNSRLPESKVVAEHYAAMRQVPANQVFGFALTTNEVMTRADFTDFLQKPLAAKLEAAKIWKFGNVAIPAANGQPAHTENRVVESKIRYAALCYGVPLKIAPSSLIEEITQKLTREEFRRNEAAVDSELAWLPICRADIPLTGPLPNPFYTTTNRTVLNCTNGLLLVTRLDGPTAEIANHLVDKAMEAESNGFWGRAYFDARGIDKTNSYYQGDLWILGAAEICHLQGFDVEVDTNGETWPVSRPMSQIAFYAGWYEGNVNGPFLDKHVEFMPGAFAYHLHSFSADTLRSTNSNWCGPLLALGATCTMGCVYEPYLQFTPNIACFAQSICSGWTFGESAWASQVAASWQTTIIGDPLYQPFKKAPPVLHGELERSHSPLVEWSLNRLMNLDLVRGVRPPQLSSFLENSPVTAQSAVLSEKLAQLYDMEGKPSSAISTWQQALKLNPSPHQRIRLHLILADNLLATDRNAEAADNWRQLIADSPDYPDLPTIREKLKALEKKIAAGK